MFTFACGIVWQLEQRILWKGIITFCAINLELTDFSFVNKNLKLMDFFFCQSTESNCVYESDRNGQKSYFTSSALVSGKGWLASISKMLLTKTLGLKVFKMAIGCCVVQKYCINVIYV